MPENQKNDPMLEYFKAELIKRLYEVEEAEKKKKPASKEKQQSSNNTAKNNITKEKSKSHSNYMLRILDGKSDYSAQIHSQCTVFKERYGMYPNVLVASKETLENIQKNSATLQTSRFNLTACESEDFKNGTYELLDVQSEILAQNHYVYPLIDMKKTGETIKRLMDENNISVKDLQKMLRLASVQAIYYWLNGEKLPSIDNLCVLSNIFNTPIDDLLSVKLIEED